MNNELTPARKRPLLVQNLDRRRVILIDRGWLVVYEPHFFHQIPEAHHVLRALEALSQLSLRRRGVNRAVPMCAEAEMIAPFMYAYTCLPPVDLGDSKLESAYAYNVFTPCSSNPLEPRVHDANVVRTHAVHERPHCHLEVLLRWCM
jgi:hypothetical protein